MEIPPAVLQFLGSLIAICLLAALAYWLKLGPERRLETEEQARSVAEETMEGFHAVELALDREGHSALLRDASGRILLLRQHGTHFVGRLLTRKAKARLAEESLTIDTGERRFGTATLRLADPLAWKRQIDGIG